MKCGTTVALDNTVLRHFIAKIVFFGGSDPQGKKILEKTSFSDRKALEQSYWHPSFPLSVVKLSNTFRLFTKLLATFLRSGFSPV